MTSEERALAGATDAEAKGHLPSTGWTARLAQWIPLLATLRSYRKSMLRGDLSAGVTTAVMLIPQGMAYAMLAGLPPIVGLYAATVPLVVYAFFGSSRELAIGPVAMVSILVAAGVAPLVELGLGTAVELAIILAFLVGTFQLLLGFLRAGFLVNFLSHPVISGFTSAAAVIIAVGQLPHLLGITLPRMHRVDLLLFALSSQLTSLNLPTLVIGAASVGLLLAGKRYRPTFPWAVLVTVIATLVAWIFGLQRHGVAIVGVVPRGLPEPGLPNLQWATMRALLPSALTLALIGFTESFSVAKALARRNRYRIGPDQELRGLGLANLAGCFFGAYPVAGGFARSAVNASAGAKSAVAGIITALLIALSLLFLTPLFTYLPRAVLAAIIFSAVIGLIDLAEASHLWKVKRSDFALLLLTVAATLTLGVEQGLLLGVGASLLWFVVRTTRPHFAVLGRVPGTRAYRNLRNYPDAEVFPGVLIVRMDAQFYFGNVSFLEETLEREEARQSVPLAAVVIDASAMNQLDATAADALAELHRQYAQRGIRLVLAAVKRPVSDVLTCCGLTAVFGHYPLTVDDAVAELRAANGAPR